MKFIDDLPKEDILPEPNEVRVTFDTSKALLIKNLPGFIYRARDVIDQQGYMTTGQFFKQLSVEEINFLNHVIHLHHQKDDLASNIVLVTAMILMQGEGQIDFTSKDIKMYFSRIALLARMCQLENEGKANLIYENMSITDPDPSRKVVKQTGVDK